MKKNSQITATAAALALLPVFALGGVTLPGGGGTGDDTGGSGSGTVEIDPTQPIDPELIAQGITDSAKLECKENPASCGITLEDILGKVAFGETEPNNYALSADPLTPALPMTGQLSRQSDEDWYVFETTSDNDTVTTLFTAQSNSLRLSIKDSKGNLLTSNDSASGDQFSFDTTLAHAGVYYLVVEPSVAGEGSFTNAGYQVTVFIRSTGSTAQQPDYNFHDVETEFNDYFTTADAVITNLVTEGQIISGRDRDIYRIDTAGNEIIHLELCYPNTSCFNEGTWAMFVYDPTKQAGTALNDGMLDANLQQCRMDDEGFVTCIYAVGEGGSTYPGQDADRPPLYYLTEFGRFDAFWIGNIDPSFGNEYALDIAAERPGTLYVAIVPVLGRNGAGDIVQNLASIKGGPDVFGLVFDPFSEDQYTFRVSTTVLQPSSEGSAVPLARALEKSRSTFDGASNQLHLGEVVVGDRVYSADMQLQPYEGKGTLEFALDLEDIHPVTVPAVVTP
jgi:hypothetical protein